MPKILVVDNAEYFRNLIRDSYKHGCIEARTFKEARDHLSLEVIYH